MTAGLLRRASDKPGHTLSILYFANSFGAAAGVLLAGFWLLEVAGLPGTLLMASGVNIVVALGALLVAGRYPAQEAMSLEPRSSGDDLESVRDTDKLLPRILLVTAFGTAVASFVYEIGWIRMLSLVVGSATHSFELMLSAFILGLALGALWVRKHADRWQHPVEVLAIVQLCMGFTALLTIFLYSASFGWMETLMRTFARTDAGYTGFSLSKYAISLAVMLPSTFCAGITLPLITRILLTRGSGEKAIGQVYGVNTFGSILGVVLAGLVLMPVVGLKNLIVVGGVLDMALGAAILWVWTKSRGADQRMARAAAMVTGVLALTCFGLDNFDRSLMASSVYREGALLAPGIESVFHEDGRTATVSVTRRPPGVLTIATNGKVDGSLSQRWLKPCSDDSKPGGLGSDAATQFLAPLITAAHAPKAKLAAVIGVGTGISSHAALSLASIEKLVTVEIEPAIVEGARAFHPANARMYDDPRSEIVYDDAKSYFASSGQQFDFIFSEPSNPWVSGVASLFSVEFYERVSQHLSEEGVFGQWLHLYEIDDGLVLSVLAAIHQHFASYTLYLTWDADILIVASNTAATPEPDWSVFAGEAILKDLCHVHPLKPAMLDKSRVLDRAALAPLLDRWGGANSDFYPMLDLGAERTRYLKRSAKGLVQLASSRFDFVAALTGQRVLPTSELVVPVRDIASMRSSALAAGLRTPDAAAALPVNARVPKLRGTLFQLARWNAVLEKGVAPSDWKQWLADFAAMERAVHGDTAGYVEQSFYDSVNVFLEKARAPELVRHAVGFRQGLAGWNFEAVSRAGDRLVESVLKRQGYIPTDEFFDGMIIAKLQLSKVDEARQVFNRFASKTGRAYGDLRLRLLDAYIESAR
jgi:predicted membrane-bound spermidine synthase